MIGDSFSSSCTKRVRVAKVLEPWATLDIQWFKQIIVSMKLVILQIRCLEHHFPFVSKVVIFEFSTKVPREFVEI